MTATIPKARTLTDDSMTQHPAVDGQQCLSSSLDHQPADGRRWSERLRVLLESGGHAQDSASTELDAVQHLHLPS
jgi:hypothetical protein